MCLQDAAPICSTSGFSGINYGTSKADQTQTTYGHCVQRDGVLRLVQLELFFSNYSTLHTVIEEVNNTGRYEYVMQGAGFLRIMKTFTTFFGVKPCIMLFSTREQLSCTLESKDTKMYKVLQYSPSHISEGRGRMMPLISSMYL